MITNVGLLPLKDILSSMRERLQSTMSVREQVKPVSLIGLPQPRFKFGEFVSWTFDSENGNHYVDKGVIVGIVFNHPDLPTRPMEWAYYVAFHEMPSDPHLDLPWTDLMTEDELEPNSGE
jgi:hypothetical protein